MSLETSDRHSYQSKSHLDLDIAYQMLYQGMSENQLAGGYKYRNQPSERVTALFERHVPNYKNLPFFKISSSNIEDGYFHLTKKDLGRYDAIRGVDCSERLFVALHVKSKKSGVQSVVTVFQLDVQESTLAASSSNDKPLGHNELFRCSTPSWKRVTKTIIALLADTHSQFKLIHGISRSKLKAPQPSNLTMSPSRLPTTPPLEAARFFWS